MAQEVTHHVGDEMGAIVAFEDERGAVFGEQSDQGGDGGIGVGVVAGQGQEHAARGEVADAQQVTEFAIDGDGRFGVVDGPDGAEPRPGAGAVGLQPIIAVAPEAVQVDEAGEFSFRQARKVILQGGHTDGVSPEVHEVADLVPLGWRGDGGGSAEQRGGLGDGVAPAT